MRRGIDGVGVSAVGLGESPLAPLPAAYPISCIDAYGCFDKQSCAGELAVGFLFLGFISFVWVGYVLGDDHSLMGGCDNTYYGGVVALLG